MLFRKKILNAMSVITTILLLILDPKRTSFGHISEKTSIKKFCRRSHCYTLVFVLLFTLSLRSLYRTNVPRQHPVQRRPDPPRAAQLLQPPPGGPGLLRQRVHDRCHLRVLQVRKKTVAGPDLNSKWENEVVNDGAWWPLYKTTFRTLKVQLNSLVV